MRTITKITFGTLAVGVMIAGPISPSMADQVDVIVSGADLTATTAGATLSGVTLNGTGTQTATGTSSEWTLTDARGTGAAWSVSVVATVPTSAAGTESGETTARTIPVSNLSIDPGAITASAGSDPATGITAPELALSETGQALISASADHKGTYTLTPTFSLDVPVNAYRSNFSGEVNNSALNPYVSTVTLTIG